MTAIVDCNNQNNYLQFLYRFLNTNKTILYSFQYVIGLFDITIKSYENEYCLPDLQCSLHSVML